MHQGTVRGFIFWHSPIGITGSWTIFNSPASLSYTPRYLQWSGLDHRKEKKKKKIRSHFKTYFNDGRAFKPFKHSLIIAFTDQMQP